MDEGLAEHEEKIEDFLLYFEKTWIGKNKVMSFKPFVKVRNVILPIFNRPVV